MSEVLAKGVFDTLIDALSALGYTYDVKNALALSFTAGGNDIPMHFNVTVDADKKIVILSSRLPLTVEMASIEDMAIAVCAANYSLCDGSFDYFIPNKEILFRMTTSYLDSDIGVELLDYMIRCATMTVDRYNDKLLMLSRGLVTLDEFLDEIGFQ